MKVALVGYGAMGKTVETTARARGHEVAAVIDPNVPEASAREISAAALNGAEIAIDFSHPTAVMGNVRALIPCGVNVLVGATGWYDKIDEVRSDVQRSAIGFLWSSNFSIGVNIYFKLVEHAARLMNEYDEYDVWGTELHHNRKADSPSGTAKTLEKIILANLNRKTQAIEDRLDRKIRPNEFHFSSTRGGAVNFSHTVGFDSAIDTITLTHSARSNQGYALGAVKAAEWLRGRRGFFSMSDFLSLE